MARMAEIENGVVKNIVVVPDARNFEASQHEVLASDHVPVADHVKIGWKWDATANQFVQAVPIDPWELFIHAMRRFNEQDFAPITLSNGQIVTVVFSYHDLLSRLAAHARTNSNLIVPWPMYHERQPPIMLNAAQIIELDDKVTEWEMRQLRAYKGVTDGIASGVITNHDHIDAPPPPLPQWPPRFLASGQHL
jgi:hypothetical protein